MPLGPLAFSPNMGDFAMVVPLNMSPVIFYLENQTGQVSVLFLEHIEHYKVASPG